MKRDEILQAVDPSFKIFNKLSRKIVEDFDISDIHDFRVEFKNLRAFLRLLSVETNNNKVLPTKKMKTFYGYAGIIRNIQLQQEMVANYADKKQLPKPFTYLQILDTEALNWKKEITELMKDKNFYEDEEYIVKNIPDKLTKASIKQFVADKVTNIKVQMTHLHSEESLHTIRKILKDLMYTWPYINAHALLPEFINSKQSLKSLTTLIGDFNDLCMQLMFLSTTYLDKIKEVNEKSVLQKITKDCLARKSRIKKQIIAKLKLIDFEAYTPHNNKLLQPGTNGKLA